MAVWRLYEYILIDILLLGDISNLRIKPSNKIYFHLHIFTQHQSRLTQHGISPHHQALTLAATKNDISLQQSMRNFFRKIFGRQKHKENTKAFPSDWNLTISDLFEELKTGKRKEIKDPEMSWAREYERSLLPSTYRFPQKGDLYVASFDQDVSFMTSWSAPYTGGGTTKLFEGEQIWVDSNPMDEKPIGAYLVAVDYKDLENRIVSESDRNSFKYDSFYFHISTKTLNENFRLVKTGFKKDKFT